VKDSERRQHLVRAVADLRHFAGAHDVVLAVLRQSRGGFPSGAAIENDRTSGHSTVLDTWCERHQKDGCCGGHPVPTASDPTGETALRPHDPARRDLERLDKLIKQISDAASEIHQIDQRWRTPAAAHKAMTEACELCARHGHFEPELAFGNVGGRLPRNYRLGRWCYDFVAAVGVLPVDWQIDDHHRGKRVRLEPSEPRAAIMKGNPVRSGAA